MAIRVNRILSKKQNIAGIPADVFIPAFAFDIIFGVFGCLLFALPPIQVAVFCITLNIVWAILVAKGVWRFLGSFYKPPRYYRSNIRYQPFLQTLIDNDSRPSKGKKAKKSKRRNPARQR
jgi:hypothetical protein